MAVEMSFQPYRPRELFRKYPLSMLVGSAMVGLAVVVIIAMLSDSRRLHDELVWLKPLKFAISAALYLMTMPWLLEHLVGLRRFRRWASAVGAMLVLLEVALITLQAARGVPSHFNCLTPLDCWIYKAMGAGVGLLWLSQLAIAVVLLRKRFSDPALGWSLRFAVLLAILGGGVGWLMCQPTEAQYKTYRAGVGSLLGSHTVGAPDGGRGLPLTSWSLEHGDLRVAHFVGIHGLQVLPVAGMVISRRRRLTRRERVRWIAWAGGSYAVLFGLLLLVALLGQPLVCPPVVCGLGGWLLVTLGGCLVLTGLRWQRLRRALRDEALASAEPIASVRAR